MLWTIIALSVFLSAGVGVIALCGRAHPPAHGKRPKKSPPLRAEP